MNLRRQIVTAAVLATIAPSAQAQVFRWDNNQLIPGTESIPPGPSANFASLALDYAQLTSKNLTSANFTSASLASARFDSSTLTSATFTNSIITGASFARHSLGTILTSSQLSTTASYASRNLSGINFTYNSLASFNFTSQDLTSANFTSAQLTDAILTSAIFSGATITRTSFSRTTFGTGLTPAQLTSTASFAAKNLAFINFARNDLSGCDFSSQNLTGAGFGSAVLAGASFESANLAGAILNSANLTSANLRSAIFTGFASLTSANLTGADISRADFSRDSTGTRLSFAQLASTASYLAKDLSGINFLVNNLTSFDLTSQNLTSTNFGAAILTGANLTGAIISHARFDRVDGIGGGLTVAQLSSTASYAAKDLSYVDVNSNSLASANFSSQNLSNSNFAYASLTSANFASANLSLADLRSATGFTPDASTITRAAILPTGQIAGAALNPSETLLIRYNFVSATATGTLAGPATAVIQVDPSGTIFLSPTASPTSATPTLKNLSLSLRGTPASQANPYLELAIARATTVTAIAGHPRPLLPTVTILSSLTISNDAKPLGTRTYYGLLDLTTNDAILHNDSLAEATSTLTNIRDMARAFLQTTKSTGIGSLTTIPNTRLAILDNNANGTSFFSTFDGQPTTTTDILARFTYTGDTNLDGILNATDLSNLIEGLSTGATGWQSGDLNYDNAVNTADLSLFLAAYNAFLLNPISLGSPSDSTAGTGNSVPEPSTLAPLALLPLTPRRLRRPH